MSSNTFHVGVAEVTGTSGPCVTVRCPFCRGSHRHDRSFAGSREVVAGCHSGYSRARVYSIPKHRAKPAQ
jgi:hypothetical protein